MSDWNTSYKSCTCCGTTKLPFKAKGLCTKCYANETNLKLGAKQLFTCITCGVKFSPKHYSSIGRKFCSKDCDLEYKTGQIRCRFTTKIGLLNHLECVILEAGKYLTQRELLSAAKISYETLKKFDISIIELHNSVGIRKKRVFFEDISFYLLKDVIPDLRYNHVFPNCVSPEGRVLKFDLYSEALNLVIEIDGEHHRWNTTQALFQKVQWYDRLKDKYTYDNGISMVRIPVAPKQRITLEFLLGYINPYLHSNTDSTNHNATSNGNRDGLKIVENEAISSQAA